MRGWAICDWLALAVAPRKMVVKLLNTTLSKSSSPADLKKNDNVFDFYFDLKSDRVEIYHVDARTSTDRTEPCLF